MNVAPQLYLLDGSSFIYRAYYGVRDRATVTGLPTNAIFGFTRMLLGLLQENNPDYLAVVFDRPREETFRRQLYAEYKANRDETPADLVDQIPYIKQMVEAFNIPALEALEFEADDVIATLARRFSAQGIDVTVVTGDKDLMQIVDEHISLLDTMKDKRSYPTDVVDRFGVPAALVADVLGLAGDTSDNIPGVPGIGEKIAAKLIQQFGSLEEVLRLKRFVDGKKRRQNLAEFEQQALLSKTLATVRYDVELAVDLEQLRCQKPNLRQLIPLLRQLEFDELEVAFTPPPVGVVELYSDGSGTASGPGGYGVVLRYGEHEKDVSGFEPHATSQRMEQLAAIRGLEAITKPQTVQVFSDSQYLVRGMNEWIEGWIRNGRLNGSEGPDGSVALANQDLWKQLYALSKVHCVSWHWVKGHSGHPFNERCDKLAKQAVVDGIRGQQEPQPSAVVPCSAEVADCTTTVPAIVSVSDAEGKAREQQFNANDEGQFSLY
ncbi:MAG: ribonuclease HI [Deltaproteobacteria bacterium]|nr:ribonuclease HI [Deltaproteobacteria bacterium]